MNTAFLTSFLTDVKRVRDVKVRRAVANAIANVERAQVVSQVPSLKRLSGAKDYSRIRIGDWRIGVIVRDDTVTFVRCLHRREIYRYFP